MLFRSFENKALASILMEFSDGVVDLGGGYLDYLEEDCKSNILNALELQRDVFCLLPYRDFYRSTSVLKDRMLSRHKTVSLESLKPIFELNDNLISFYMRTDLPLRRIFTEEKDITQLITEVESNLNE